MKVSVAAVATLVCSLLLAPLAGPLSQLALLAAECADPRGDGRGGQCDASLLVDLARAFASDVRGPAADCWLVMADNC